MVQSAGGARFALQALEHDRIVPQAFGNELERDTASETRVLSFVNDAHATRAKRRNDLIRAYAGTGCGRHLPPERRARFYSE
jgi:hypothetical protein